jgi:hypothetical protein
MHVGIAFGLEDYLGKPMLIPQIDKDDTTMVPAALNPSHQHHFLADIVGAQFTIVMGSAHISQQISHCSLSFQRTSLYIL